MSAKQIERLISSLTVLVVDDNMYTRKLLRMMLMNLGAKMIYEAADGVAALDLIRTVNPDIVILDWMMPVLNGPQLMRIIRSPGVFPNPDVPVILLTAHGQRSQVNKALRLGVNEFLVKPVSPKALYDRLLSILVKPRPMVRIGKFYVPQPRLSAAQQYPTRSA
jgi:two-component system chemotaxis response regulator CheY